MALQKITGDIIADDAIPKDAIANDAVGLDQLDVVVGAFGASEGQVLSIDSSGGLVLEFPSAASGGGKVLQCVSFTKTDTFSTSAAVDTDTGLEVSITPEEQTSSCLVMINFDYSITDNGFGSARIKRLGDNSTILGLSDSFNTGSRPQGTFNLSYPERFSSLQAWTQSCGITFLDLHNSSVNGLGTLENFTYGLQVRVLSSGDIVHLNRSFDDTDSAAGGRAVSTITVMEIAAPSGLGGGGGGTDGGFL